MSLSRQLIALVLTTKDKETKHYIQRNWKNKHKNLPIANAQKLNPFCIFTTSGKETEQALFLQSWEPTRGLQADGRTDSCDRSRAVMYMQM